MEICQRLRSAKTEECSGLSKFQFYEMKKASGHRRQTDVREHDKIIGHGLRIRPDYKSDALKLIVEFGGIQHYTNSLQIIKDFENTKKYEALSYKVIRIPYFIQLSKTAVKTLFGIDTHDLFDDKIPSLSTKSQNTPAFLCPQGIIRMASDFLKFPEQYKSNIDALEKEDETLSGVKYLEDTYLRLSEGNC